MNQKILGTAKKVTPPYVLQFARRCLIYLNRIHDRNQIKVIQKYYIENEPDDDVTEILQYLPICGLRPFPYKWAERGNSSAVVEVYFDEKQGLHYVFLDGKRLYYPKDMEIDAIQNSYDFVQRIEQHPLSPHRYLTSTFDVSENDIVVDCGSAEGNFGLSVIDRVKKLYLFEPETRWIEPLKATFAPWADKVVIIQTYLSDSIGGGGHLSETIDNYFSGEETPTFLKLDVEGYEEKVLAGARKSIESGSIQKIVTCTYHYAEDEQKLGDLLRSYGYVTTPSSGYMIFSMYDSLRPPYFRRGLLRCVKE